MSSRAGTQFQEGHLKQLLDQRAARADLHSRFPSLSEFSDSPSVYSHAFSPRPHDRTDIDPGTSSYHYAHRHDFSEPLSPMSDRQRLKIPHASSIDLDHESRSSMAFSDMNDEEDDESTEEGHGDDGRVSAYGPKVTVHSRAPWEMEEDDDCRLTPESERRGAFNFGLGDTNKKGWGFGTRSANDYKPRPSVESARSQDRPKASFETTSSNISAGSALIALAQTSMSSTSLTLSSSPQASLKDKLGFPRFRTRTYSNTPPHRLEPVDTRACQPSSTQASPVVRNPTSPVGLEFSYDFPLQSAPPSPHTPMHQQEFHPYANPDLARRYAREHETSRKLEELHILAGSAPQSPIVVQSDSSATLTESSTVTTISQSRSYTSGATVTPVTSLSSVQTCEVASPSLRGTSRGILVPVPVDTASIRSNQSSISNSNGAPFSAKREQFMPLPGWAENTNSAPIKLISLEEAQARERTRSATANGTATTSGSRTNDNESAKSSIMGWPRMRSTSAAGNTRARNMGSTSVTELTPAPMPLETTTPSSGPPPQKTIVKKKSGFMRMFGKDKVSPPPVPSLGNEYFSPLPSPAPVSTSHKHKNLSTHRVPVPSISPSLWDSVEESSSSHSGVVRKGSASSVASGPPKDQQINTRRNLPGLSIVTNSVSNSSLAARYIADSHPTPTTAATDIMYSSMLSAGPLSLRPVSTAFSANFSDHIVDQDLARPSLETDNGTPTTSISSVISPISPVDPYSREGKGAVAVASSQEDQSNVIQALQEQIIAARRIWQQQIWELEGQVHDLKAEVEDLRAAECASEYCAACGRGSIGKPGAESSVRLETLAKAGVKVSGVVNRPRARTGVGSRFASGT